MSDSRNLNCSQSTTKKWAVSNERQHGGVEKKTPIDPMPMGAIHGRDMNEWPHPHFTDSLMQTRCQGKEAEVVGTLIYAASSGKSSRSITLSTKASDSVLLFLGICALRPLPTAQNFPKAIPTTTATDSQISSMNITFIAFPLTFNREKSAMNMPNHREESEVMKKKTPIDPAHSSRWG